MTKFRCFFFYFLDYCGIFASFVNRKQTGEPITNNQSLRLILGELHSTTFQFVRIHIQNNLPITERRVDGKGIRPKRLHFREILLHKNQYSFIQ